MAAIGCSWDDLLIHLEDQFQTGMTWDNYGASGWHIDHIVPLAILDMNDPIEFHKAWHYTNLRPLWAIDNLRKGKRAA